jgi:hypothetical protein
MKIECIGILRFNEDTPDAVALDAAYNLAEYGFFQRGTYVAVVLFICLRPLQLLRGWFCIYTHDYAELRNSSRLLSRLWPSACLPAFTPWTMKVGI